MGVDVYVDSDILLSPAAVKVLTENANERLRDMVDPDRRRKEAMRKLSELNSGIVQMASTTKGRDK